MLHVGCDTGNPRVYFFIPVPVPANTVPARVGVRCLSRVSTGHRGYSRVSTELGILIIYYTKLMYIHNKNAPLSRLERGRGLSSLRTEQKNPPARVCSERGGGLVPSRRPHPHCTPFPPHEQLLVAAVGGAVLVVVLRHRL